MSIGSLWRDLRSDFAQNTRGGKNTARCGAVISAVGVLVATFGAVGTIGFSLPLALFSQSLTLPLPAKA
jgi:hypothetical protein